MGQIVVCILMILLTNCSFTNATLTPNTGIKFNQANHQKGLLPHLIGGGEANKSFSTYKTDHIAIQMFEIRLENVIDNLFNKLEANCATITLWNNICEDDTTSCQLAEEEIQTSESAIVILSQSLFSMRQVCELPNYPSSEDSIKRCHKGQSWTTSQGVNE